MAVPATAPGASDGGGAARARSARAFAVATDGVADPGADADDGAEFCADAGADAGADADTSAACAPSRDGMSPAAEPCATSPRTEASVPSWVMAGSRVATTGGPAAGVAMARGDAASRARGATSIAMASAGEGGLGAGSLAGATGASARPGNAAAAGGVAGVPATGAAAAFGLRPLPDGTSAK
jgi:hypothetical protein